MPPHLAGREAEQKAFAKCFEFLRQHETETGPLEPFSPVDAGWWRRRLEKVAR